MKIEHFEILAKDRFDHCLNLMVGKKHNEYSRQNDKLHNFKVAGRIKNETPEKALWGMYVKHLVSVQDIINDLDSGNIPAIEALMEKISDNINYHVLLEALILERLIVPSVISEPE